MDSDWASGAGDYNAVNDDKYYTKEELNYDSFDRPDIEVYHCADCNHLFEWEKNLWNMEHKIKQKSLNYGFCFTIY